jgi:hypothetical protein
MIRGAVGLWLIVISTVDVARRCAVATSCADFKSAVEDAAGSYWSEVQQCSPCVTAPTCGYCLSTLRCLEGTDAGPADGSPCPKWVFAPGPDGAEPDGCPAIPRCEDYPECSAA